LELVPYLVEVVPNHRKEETGAIRCSDAKYVDGIKNRVSPRRKINRWVRRERESC
jgi:hypothetical protein